MSGIYFREIEYIRNAFDGVPPLERKPSLLDGDFFDTWHCFPSNSKFFERKDAAATTFISRFNGGTYGTKWSEYDRKYVIDSIRTGQSPMKNERWWEVSPEYIGKYSMGLSFLPPDSFLFYAPAVMISTLDGHENEVGVASDSLEYHVSLDHSDLFGKFSLSQKKAVCVYLRAILTMDDRGPGDERLRAALAGAWAEYDR